MRNDSQTLRVIFSGGGTGGHIFPAIAIADQLKALVPDADIRFVGAKGRMEMERVPKAGYPIEGLWISGIQRKLTFDNLLFPIKLVSSLWNARRILRRVRPHVVVGTGGYASGPLLRQAAAMGIPTLIQEQNAYAGLTNKWLAALANRICVAYPGMERYFPAEKLLEAGNPVREACSPYP
ncbi:MAG: glycosyltransferase [Saprospiraceae bacterium]